MLKDKLSAPLIVGGMAVIGLVAGIATMASAQTTTPTPIPTVATATVTQTADTPEAGDVADTATRSISASHTGTNAESSNDADGTAGAETSEPAGSTDTGSDQ